MKKYEFSYVDNDFNMHFIVLFDEELLSACERILFRSVKREEIREGQVDNFFIDGWQDTHFTIHVSPYEPSTTCVLPKAVKPEINRILEGLI